MMHAVCEKCAQYKLPFQIHTGIQAGNYNTLTNAKPTHLTKLFRKFPDVSFDLFHGGYPYIQEAGLLAKYFPNVYLDACWLAHISPVAYKRGLDEWLEIVPSNKIFAWGGDHGIIEHSYASLKLARTLVSEVLAAKVDTGYFSKKIARSVAEKIMGGNAIEVYKF
jgi:predicted TIM-barrel fold metal-dependent hydrolase